MVVLLRMILIIREEDIAKVREQPLAKEELEGEIEKEEEIIEV